MKKISDLNSINEIKGTDQIPVHDGNGLKKVEVERLVQPFLIEESDCGDIAVMPDSTSAPISEVVIYGKTTQAQTPSPSIPAVVTNITNPYITVTGRNLIPYPFASGIGSSSNGLTSAVDDDGYIVINGTATSNTDFLIYSWSDKKSMMADGLTWTLSASPSLPEGLTLRFTTQKNGAWKSDINGAPSVVCDFSGIDADSVRAAYIRIISGTVCNNVRIRPILSVFDGEDEPYKQNCIRLNGITLRGLPVTSENNYTSHKGEKWISDELHIRADGTGCLVQRLREITVTSVDGVSSNGGKRAIIRSLVGGAGHNPLSGLSGESVISDRLTAATSTVTWAGSQNWCMSAESDYIAIRLDDNYTTKAQYDAWLAENPVTFVYVLAEPVVTELTREQVSGWVLNSFKGGSTIRTDKAAGVKVTYAVDPKKYIDQFIEESDIPTLRADFLATKADLNTTKETFLALSDSLGDLSATISNLFTIQRTGKIYSIKVWKCDANPTQVCEKLDDNAGLVMEPSSATVEGRDDYADIPLFKWWHCNYEVDGAGFRKPTHIAGSAFYSESGSAEVGSLFMTPYYRIQDFEEYQIISISDTKHDGFTTPAGAFDEEGVEHPYMIVPAYMMVQADDGYLRSQPDKPVKVFLSHMTINQAIKAKTPDGDGGQAWMMWLVMMMIMIKTGKKSSQATFPGCTDMNYQYPAAEIYADERNYFPLTPTQASRFFVGAPIAVGYEDTSNTSPIDRSRTTMFSYGVGRVTAIESLSSSVTAVYVDVPPFATSDVGEAKVYLSSWPWYTGSTRGVKGHHDGALVNDARHPFRVHGIELGLGCYEIPSDLAVTINAQNGRILYRRPMGMTAISNQAQIESGYELVGEIPDLNSGSDYYIGDCDMSNEIGTPTSSTSSTAYGIGDRVYWGGSATSGCREWLRLGIFWYGSYAGLGFVHLGASLASAGWFYGGRG